MTEPLHYKTITELSGLIKNREISPVEITEAQLARIGTVDGRLKSYATVMTDQAMAEARAAEAEIAAGRYRGPLHGVPVAVKDLCYTTGVRTMGGMAVLEDHVPDFDATVVGKFREAGAVNRFHAGGVLSHEDVAFAVVEIHPLRDRKENDRGFGVFVRHFQCVDRVRRFEHVVTRARSPIVFKVVPRPLDRVGVHFAQVKMLRSEEARMKAV